MKFPIDRLQQVVTAIFEQTGVTPEHAEITTRRLIEADLRGRTGHGLIRVPQYVLRIEQGAIQRRPDIRIARETSVSALVDGNNGLGQVVMTVAVEIAIAKAKELGMAWVGTVHSNHAGAAGVYTGLALQHDLIAMYMAVSGANVMPPWGGNEPILGTNPIAIAIPGGEEAGFQLDIATTVTSRGRIKVLADRDEAMPEGWVVTREGTPITDPKQADSGFLMPIGGYKGAGLNLAIGLLPGVLNQAAFAAGVAEHGSIPSAAANTGQAIFVMRPDLFQDSDDFKRDVDAHLAALRAAGDPGAVRIPGDTAARLEREQRAQGVSLTDTLLRQLQDLARRFRLEDDLS